ncbi:DUF4258 domain-containing protein [Desulfonatronospira sp.]|uniref:DUF4258 domain-containing protein n=1 Tax=Desulfonatronospira sp. TaxID=1962951 RepID=UPI0025C3D0C2|nr:DUF4258 domain-containing protein [Desulfonatronospira sp.]
MTTKMDDNLIARLVDSGNYQFRKHAAERAAERGIDPLDLKEGILNGKIIEHYPDDPRGYSFLVSSNSREIKYIYTSCADIRMVSYGSSRSMNLILRTGMTHTKGDADYEMF